MVCLCKHQHQHAPEYEHEHEHEQHAHEYGCEHAPEYEYEHEHEHEHEQHAHEYEYEYEYEHAHEHEHEHAHEQHNVFGAELIGCGGRRAQKEKDMNDNETDADVRARNSEIAHWSRALQEVIHCWGSVMHRKKPLYHGIDCKLLFNRFSYAFLMPTIT